MAYWKWEKYKESCIKQIKHCIGKCLAYFSDQLGFPSNHFHCPITPEKENTTKRKNKIIVPMVFDKTNNIIWHARRSFYWNGCGEGQLFQQMECMIFFYWICAHHFHRIPIDAYPSIHIPCLALQSFAGWFSLISTSQFSIFLLFCFTQLSVSNFKLLLQAMGWIHKYIHVFSKA